MIGTIVNATTIIVGSIIGAGSVVVKDIPTDSMEKPERILAVNTLQVKNYDRYDMLLKQTPRSLTSASSTSRLH